jgi:molybdate transport system regulatory protein
VAYALQTGRSYDLAMEPKLKVWVVFGDQTKFGDGRARLLELIDDLGSINKAVARLGMSYRTTWGYIRELETAAGFRLLRRTRGGGVHGGTRLTSEGRQFLQQYWAFRRGLDGMANRRFSRAFKRRAVAQARPRRDAS